MRFTRCARLTLYYVYIDSSKKVVFSSPEVPRFRHAHVPLPHPHPSNKNVKMNNLKSSIKQSVNKFTKPLTKVIHKSPERGKLKEGTSERRGSYFGLYSNKEVIYYFHPM